MWYTENVAWSWSQLLHWADSESTTHLVRILVDKCLGPDPHSANFNPLPVDRIQAWKV